MLILEQETHYCWGRFRNQRELFCITSTLNMASNFAPEDFEA